MVDAARAREVKETIVIVWDWSQGRLEVFLHEGVFWTLWRQCSGDVPETRGNKTLRIDVRVEEEKEAMKMTSYSLLALPITPGISRLSVNPS